MLPLCSQHHSCQQRQEKTASARCHHQTANEKQSLQTEPPMSPQLSQGPMLEGKGWFHWEQAFLVGGSHTGLSEKPSMSTRTPYNPNVGKIQSLWLPIKVTKPGESMEILRTNTKLSSGQGGRLGVDTQGQKKAVVKSLALFPWGAITGMTLPWLSWIVI